MPELAGLFARPFTDPLLVFTVALLIFFMVPYAFERLRLPGIIGLLLTGAWVGPNGLGILERDTTFVLLGQVGLLYIMFLAGLEIDLQGFFKTATAASPSAPPPFLSRRCWARCWPLCCSG